MTKPTSNHSEGQNSYTEETAEEGGEQEQERRHQNLALNPNPKPTQKLKRSKTRDKTRIKNLIAGLSGPSSSGKTSLARLLTTVLDGIQTHVRVGDGWQGEGEEERGGRARWDGRVEVKVKVKVKVVVLHEDDFYKPEEDIPIITTPTTHRRLQDWDCADSLNIPRLERTLRHFHTHGTLPEDLRSKEDRNTQIGTAAAGEGGMDEAVTNLVAKCREEVASTISGCRGAATVGNGSSSSSSSSSSSDDDHDIRMQLKLNICILEGFLLYPNPNLKPKSSTPSISTSILPLLTPTLRLFLRSTLALVRARREARKGCYAITSPSNSENNNKNSSSTRHGNDTDNDNDTDTTFWFDPPGYVDEVVWPNYARDHAWMFEAGDVEGGGLVWEERAKWRLVAATTTTTTDAAAADAAAADAAAADAVNKDFDVDEEIKVAPGFGEIGLNGLLEWGVEIFRRGLRREVLELMG